MKINRLFLLPGIIFLLNACVSDKPPTDNTSIGNVAFSPSTVWVINEGNFQFGNGSLGLYKPEDSTYAEKVFENANSRPLGDVFQSVSIFNNKAYLVINNSGRIEVINPDDFKSLQTISGLNSPRYFLPLSANKAYVSDLYSNSITVLNLADGNVMGQIPCKGWSEEMLSVFGKVFVTRPESEFLLVIDAANDQVTDSVQLAYNSNSIIEDANGKLWVLCSGSIDDQKPGGLFRIDPTNLVVEQSFSLPATQSPGSLDISLGLDTLYYLTNDIYQIPFTATTLPSQAFIQSNNNNFYGVDVHGLSGHIYVSDAIDFNQRGRVMIYNSKGELLHSFKSGIIPNGIFLP